MHDRSITQFNEGKHIGYNIGQKMQKLPYTSGQCSVVHILSDHCTCHIQHIRIVPDAQKPGH